MTKLLMQTLQKNLAPGGFLTAEEVGEKHFVDFSGEHACAPLALVRPRTVAELGTVLRLCNEHGQAVVVQGGMTGLTGGATPRRGELALSLERLTGIEEIDAASMTATVLAGTPLQTVQQAAAEAGLMLPLDLGARGTCTIGGNIATNAGGNQVIRFGMMRNLVLGLEAVLADGTTVSSMNRMLKNNAGYDLKQLFIGTEGTLGIVTRAVLRLYPEMPAKMTAICAVPGFEQAVSLLQSLQRDLAGGLSAFEAMWASYFHYVTDHVNGLRSPFAGRHGIYILVETEGANEEQERRRFENALESAFSDGIVEDAVLAGSQTQAGQFWSIRDAIAEITPMLQPMLAFDVSMPIRRMPAFLERIEREFEANPGTVQTLVFGHLGDNNLHVSVTTGTEGDFERLSDVVYSATREQEGSISAEHGIGMLRRDYLHLSRNPQELALMRTLKAALDPNGILNPGRVIPDQASRPA